MLDRSCRNLIRYYRACYQADNRDLTLFNVFHRNCESTRFIQGRESLISGELPRYPLPRSYGEGLYQSQTLYKREKTLLYGSFFLLGKLPPSYPGKRTVCAPLLYYQAQVSVENNEYYLTIEKSKPIVNWPLLRWILAESSQSSEPEFINKDITERDVAKLSHWISSLSNNINCLELYHYPKLATAEQIEAKQTQIKTDQFSLIAASAVTLINYSVASRGILHDLKAMAVASYMPNSVTQFLLGEKSNDNEQNRPNDKYGPQPPDDLRPAPQLAPAMPDNIPAVLSKAQRDALYNASRHTVSQIIGPPGTGKSYTIACLALERYLQGESVLVVGQNNESVNIVGDKIESMLGQQDFVVRVGNASYHKKLKRYLKDLLSGYLTQQNETHTPLDSLQKQKLKMEKLERQFAKRCKKAIRYGMSTWKVQQNANFLNRFSAWWAKRATLNQDILFDVFAQITQQQRIRHVALGHYISESRRKRLHKVLTHHRRQLNSFREAINANNSAQQEASFDKIDYSVLLQAMPVWLGTLGDLHRSLPLKAELFDLVIIDEASQCDIASVLPAIYRAKHLVIVGDNKQLRFISFLSSKKQNKLQARYDLASQTDEFNYRNVSALDLANRRIQNQHAIVVLDEHFRSKSALIDFSNRKFYHRQLKIMRHKPGNQGEYPISIIKCQGEYNSGKNQQEAITLLEFLRNKIHNLTEMELTSSIGILSPFREQTILLTKLIGKYLSPDQIERHKIKIETAYGFQGEERDIMLISMCVDESSSGQQYRYMNREDVFNVAITRARDEQYIFLSTRPHKLPSQSLLFEYIHSIERNQSYSLDDVSDFDAFQAEVSRLLTINGINTWKNYPIAGAELDLVCQYGENTVALDLIGYPGESQDYYHLSRYKIFQRAGLILYPLTYTRWVYQKHQVLKQLMSLLGANEDALTSKENTIF
ncbi:AAA domain-containing protein [Motilimonas sp. E26]|uniref:AAA domain-containing protein n=1 Tax=Motilimonas sp. E26 TaxID=2865674 RepID=UPI001E491A15|nr:AAA domain-containing protein [Motilimonas sp. E26]MCE0558246.1 AAA family ATPase [Motilimonas sp. E26]